MMPIIYIDMDGVLADLEGGIRSWFKLGEELIDRSTLFKSYLPEYAQCGRFEAQESLPKAKMLVSYLLALREQGVVNLAILTSGGQFHNFPSMVFQKTMFLEREFPELKGVPFCATTSGADKSYLAHPKAFLIDDWHKNITHFVNAGGHGVVYSPKKYHETINAIVKFLGR